MKHTKPFVSVVMPVYNSERYLLESINSVLDQTYLNFELIIVDDGSTDNSAELINRIKVSNDRIVYIYQDNKGPGAARNRGIELATGDYIAFIDSDDIWFHDKLELQVEVLKRDLNKIVFGGSRYFWQNSKETRDVNYENFNNRRRFVSYLAHLPSNKIAFTCAVICSKKCLDKVGNFDTSLTNAEDWDLWLRLSLNYQFYAIQRPVFYRRKHVFNHTLNIPLMENINNELKVLEKMRDKLVLEGINYNKLLSEKYRQYAGKALLMGNSKLSGSYLIKSFKNNKFIFLDISFCRLAGKVLLCRSDRS